VSKTPRSTAAAAATKTAAQTIKIIRVLRETAAGLPIFFSRGLALFNKNKITVEMLNNRINGKLKNPKDFGLARINELIDS
jgi:hypothetical protein